MSRFHDNVLRGLLGAGLVGAVSIGASAPLAAEDGYGSLGYTDLRLSINTMPWDGYKGGPNYAPVRGDFDFGMRISAMAIGPMCGILPIGCETPPRLSKDVSATSDSDLYGGYDDLGYEEDLVFTEQRSASYDLLIGFELSLITMGNDGELNPLAGLFGQFFSDPGTYSLLGSNLSFGTLTPSSMLLFGYGVPEIDYTAFSLAVHFGWGFEVPTRSRGRWHWEFTPYLGAGLGLVEWTDGFTGDSDDGGGLYWEIGARAGTYYTFPNGLQIGANVRYMYNDLDVDLFGVSTDLDTTGVTFGLDLGYRF